MLGRLLSTAASTLNPATYSQKSAQLESVTEEEHTSGLLFPDASLLRRSNTHAYPLQSSFSSPNASIAGAYDDRGGLELDVVKDFRVIIAQNALGDRDACVLLDTQAPSESDPQGLGLDPQVFETTTLRRHSRASSLSKPPPPRRGSAQGALASLVEPSPLSLGSNARQSTAVSPGAFTRARGRSSSTLSPMGGGNEPIHTRHSASDSSESGLLNCIFGSSAFSYRGSSTKMHIISTDGEPTAPDTSSALRDERPDSRGLSPRAPLSRAHTTGTQPSANDPRPPSKVTILVTRMFSVNLPEGRDTSVEAQEYPPSVYEGYDNGYPFPDATKRKKIKEKKTPMYAVAITVRIPLVARNNGRPFSRVGAQGSDPSRPAGSMSFSLDSDQRWSGAFLDDSFSLASPPASLDDRIDVLVDHWDVITRTLSHLERLASDEILFLLKKVDSFSGSQPKPAKAPNMQRTNQTIVQLPPNILAGNSKLRAEAFNGSQRICTALRIPRVITGQSRWGVWREEARWISRILGEKEHSFFFSVLLTAFLGIHTEWLSFLGPDWHRRRHYLQQKAQQDAEPVLSNRTVIISPDKMTARRLIFLLSAFLPARQRFEPLTSPLRPGTSASGRPLSQSPPNVSLRQESLRRTIERRSRAQRLTLDESGSHERSVSVSSSETAHRSSEDVDSVTQPEYPKTRRESDARSIRTTNLPIHANEARMRKASMATTSATTPGSTVPVPHFASRQSRRALGGLERTAADGSDSLASENLLRNLQRSESSNISSDSGIPPAGSKWGSLLSGFWSSRQESSADHSEATSPPQDIRRKSVTTLPGKSEKAPAKLSQMAQEVGGSAEASPKVVSSDNISIPASSTVQENLTEDTQETLSNADQVKESPLKLSVRAQDGVVDVDLPLPGFVSLSSSGDSTLASPKKTRTSVTSVDAMASTQSSGSGFNFPLRDNEGPNINVAGWLKNFHEDFLLQAVRPYNSLEADIKRTMAAEATPHASLAASDVEGAEKWVDVATTLIADTRTFSIKRLRLRRKIQSGTVSLRNPTPKSRNSRPETPRQLSETTSQFTSFFSSGRSRKGSVTSLPPEFIETNEAEEKFIEEPVMDLDGTLVDALERILAQSGQSSLAHSRAPSPNRGRRGEDRMASDSAIRDDVPTVEVPRGECRKMVLGALEEIVRSVTAEHLREDVDVDLGLASDRERKRGQAAADNTLREGVRKWLLDVEETC